MKSENVILGAKYRDIVHGIEGVAVSRHIYMTGCDRITLEYVLGGKVESQTFDSPQLVLVTAETLIPVRDERQAGGPGDIPAPKAT